MVGRDDLLSYGKSQAGASGAGGTGAVQAEKFFEDGAQIFRRNHRTLVGKGDADLTSLLPCAYLNICVRVAVSGSIFQDVVEHAGKLVRIAGQY